MNTISGEKKGKARQGKTTCPTRMEYACLQDMQLIFDGANTRWMKGVKCKLHVMMLKERWLIYTIFNDVKNNVDGRF